MCWVKLYLSLNTPSAKTNQHDSSLSCPGYDVSAGRRVVWQRNRELRETALVQCRVVGSCLNPTACCVKLCNCRGGFSQLLLSRQRVVCDSILCACFVTACCVIARKRVLWQRDMWWCFQTHSWAVKKSGHHNLDILYNTQPVFNTSIADDLIDNAY